MSTQTEPTKPNQSPIEQTPIKLLHPDAKAPVYGSELAAGCDIYTLETVTLMPDEVIGLIENPFFDENKPVTEFSNDVAVKNKPEYNPYYLETKFNDPDAETHTVKRHPYLFNTGLAIQLQPDEEFEIRSRSGLAIKCDVLAFNGTIDADYRGEIKIKVWNLGTQPITIEKGTRIAQAIIKEIKQKVFIPVQELTETKRGDKGYGSTGLVDQPK